MPLLIAINAVGLFVIMAAYQAYFVARCARLIERYRPSPTNESLPHVAVLIGMRGADPFLAQSLRNIANQEYPSFEVHFVVDSYEDPAWDVVQQVVRECDQSHLHVQVYEHRADCGPVNCTNSKVVQAARRLSDDVEVIAMADADLMAHPTWLQELVVPLVEDDGIGATFGNRWYVPPDARWGTLVRYMWGATAFVGMNVLGIPWGGCYAIRMSTVRRGDLIDQWAKIVALDCATPRLLAPQRLRVAFVPSLVMANREGCSLPFAANFIRRQLTWARLYHPRWAAVVLQAAATFAALTSSAAVGVYGFATGDALLLSLCVLAWLMFLVPRLLFLSRLENVVQAALQRQGTDARPMRLRNLLKLVLSGPLCHFVHFSSLLLATFVRRVLWRGIVLEVRGPFDIRAVETQVPLVAAVDGNTSV